MSSFFEEITAGNKPASSQRVAAAATNMTTATEAPALAPGGAPIDGAHFEAKAVKAEAIAEVKEAGIELQLPEKSASSDENLSIIKIGTKQFKTVEEAMAYAAELDIKSAQDEAFIEGVKHATPPKAPEPPKPSLEEQVQDILFEDPKRALELYRKGIVDEIFNQYQALEEKKVQAQTKAQDTAALWDGFYSANPELSESKTLVKFVLQENWDKLKDLPTEKSLPQLADIVRKSLRINKGAGQAKVELPSKPAIVAGASGEATANTSAAISSGPMDFISQLNKVRRRK